MLALYHFGGAICAQKVRIALEEKGLKWQSRDCSGPALRDPEYLKLNPNGVVPTLVHGSTVINESRIISEYIEDAFDGPSLMPADPRERHRARLWSKQIDDSLHLNVFILTFATGAREIFLSIPSAARANSMPGLRDPIKRRIANELLESSLDSPWVAMAVERFRRLLNEMEVELARSPYLAGSSYSLADADYTAYIKRLSDIGLDKLWDGKPAVQHWWTQMKQRPSYQAAILEWFTAEDANRYLRSRECFATAIDKLVSTV